MITNPGFPCADTTRRDFKVYDSLNVAITPPDTACFDAPLDLTVTGGSSSAVANWDLGAFAMDQFPSGTTVSGRFTQLGDHEVTVSVTDGCCMADTAATVSIFPNPVAAFTWDSTGCEIPFDPGIANAPEGDNLEYAWDFGDAAMSTSSETVPVFEYLDAGDYDLSLTVSSTFGCIGDSTITVPVRVREEISAGFSLATPLPGDPFIEVTDGSTGLDIDDSLRYDITDGSIFTDPDFTHLFSNQGSFTITQTVSNDICSDTFSDNVTFNNDLFFAPNAFTPNGDDLNEFWYPFMGNVAFYELSIFDRWGQLIFYTADPLEHWTGEGAPIGVYQYRVQLRAGEGLEGREYLGHINLIR